MKDYYKIHQKYGGHPVTHGLRVHPTILEWIYRLSNHYEKLDPEEILNYEIEIGNWISGDMHWDTVYKTEFDPATKCITVTGFPEYGYPSYFKIEEAQLEFLLHRLRYNKATIYYRGRSVVQLILCISKEWEIEDKRIFKEQIGFNEDDNGYNNCNVLTRDDCIPRPPQKPKYDGGYCP